MNGATRLAVCAVLATAGAASALVPLVDGASWLADAVLLLAVQSAVGALARRVPLPRTATVALQALATLLLLTVVFVRDRAVAGLLPGPDAFRQFAELLRQGGDDIGRYAIPAPATPGIELMLVGGVLAVGLAVDALAVTFRHAAPAGMPLLALYSVGAGLTRDATDWLWFLAAAAGYLLLLLAEGRERLTRWGRVFGEGSGASAPARTGRRIGVLALGTALAVPLVLPAIDGGLLSPRGRGGDGHGEGGTISAVNPVVSLRDSLNQPENREVLRYRTSLEAPRDQYLRIVALDHFDGRTWRPSERQITDLPERLPAPAGLSPEVRTLRVTTSVAASDTYAQTYLPLPFPADSVRADGRWRYEPEGRSLIGDHGQTTRGLRYQVTSLLPQPTAEQLARAPEPPERMRGEYTQVPATLPEVVARRAREVTAGAGNAYERAVKLQDWFAVSGGFQYDTGVRSGDGDDAIASFLEAKRGFCVHFSFSMAAMARTLGIPARVAVGFTAGSPQGDGTMSVGSKDAHAWPELYFEGAGWTRFEPTPSRGAPPEYTVTRDPSRAGAGDPGAPGPDRSPGTLPAPSRGGTGPTPGGAEAGSVSLDGSSSTGSAPVVWAAAAGALLLVLFLAVPVWRVGIRARRLGEGSPEERTLAAWRELTDSAWDYGIAPDRSRTPRGSVERIVSAGALDAAAAAAAGRVATAVEGALYAPRPVPPGDLAGDVALVRAGLRTSAGRVARVRAVLAPPSARQLVARLRRRG
ncbi:transglutaminaseTgpA domain-containing protein [Streptomyces luteireticuli]|uniref:transglutaminase family protein n=1 Tax=Streptomyces luteireticuli TaxID=173858 RepID=UPI00355813D5